MDPEIIEAQVDEVVSPNANPTKQKPRQKEQQATQPKMSFRTRLTIKMMQLMANPKTARFFRKGWWPLWVVLGILLFSFALVAGVFFIIWKFLAALFRPYWELFTKKKS